MIGQTAQKAKNYFATGLYCAESILLAAAESLGIESEIIPQIATGFCSGIARTCGLCGAVSGAILVLNLKTGRSTPQESVEENYALVQKLVRQFNAEFGSTNCQELLGCDLNTEDGQQFYEAQNCHEKCMRYVGEAARMAMTLLEEADLCM